MPYNGAHCTNVANSFKNWKPEDSAERIVGSGIMSEISTLEEQQSSCLKEFGPKVDNQRVGMTKPYSAFKTIPNFSN